MSARRVGRMSEQTNAIRDDLARIVTDTMNEVADGLKAELRRQVIDAGMGQRLANTWRGTRFPLGDKVSLSAAAFVNSNAPEIIDAFERGATIRPIKGKFLFIPAWNSYRVPRFKGSRGQGGYMTLTEIVQKFGTNGQKIVFIPAATVPKSVKAYPSIRLDRPTHTGLNVIYAFFDIRLNRRMRQWRRTSMAKPMPQTTTDPAHLKFLGTLIPEVHLRKVLNVAQATDHWANEVPNILARRLGA
jgi:hypothetical protein